MGAGCCRAQDEGSKVNGRSSKPPKRNTEKEKYDHIKQIFDLEDNIEQHYRFGKVIGGGHFGTVRAAHLINDPSKKFAVKTINKDSIDIDVQLLINEIRTLREVDHPNVIKFYETFNDERYLHIVMELCTGGELFEYIIRKGRISEAMSAKIMQKILHGIRHLHELGIVHRDLKPQNFLFESNAKDSEPKIIDFGLARHFAKGKREMSTVVGSPYYVAPQVLHGKYDQSCDMWSIGIILYVMLCGYPPFDGPTKNSIFRAILKGQLEFDEKDWQGTSDSVKDLIKKLLNREPKERLSAEQALEHEWFNYAIKATHHNMDIDILNRLKRFRAPQLFQKEVLNVIVNMLSPSQIKQLRQTFLAIDIEGNGMISFDELQRAFKESGMDIASDEIKRILYTVDVDKNGQINYTEFLAATMDRKKAFNKQKLWLAFKHFDTEKKNYLTRDGLKKVFMREGKNYTDHEIDAMIREADLVDEDGQITFEEFCILMGYFGEEGNLEDSQIVKGEKVK